MVGFEVFYSHDELRDKNSVKYRCGVKNEGRCYDTIIAEKNTHTHTGGTPDSSIIRKNKKKRSPKLPKYLTMELLPP